MAGTYQLSPGNSPVQIAELIQDPKFRRDDVARKTYSKLRSAIAGVYAYREMWEEAEYAYRQAVDLGPESPEANFRLSQLYTRLDRYEEAIAIMTSYQKEDPQNEKIHDAIKAIKQMRQQSDQVKALAKQFESRPNDLQMAGTLMEAYSVMQRASDADKVADRIVSRPDVTADEFWFVIKSYVRLQRSDKISSLLSDYVRKFGNDPRGWREIARWRLMAQDSKGSIAAMKRYLEITPGDSLAWYQLGLIHAGRLECDEAVNALAQAVAKDANLAQRAMQDPNWNSCRPHPRFAELTRAAAPAQDPRGDEPLEQPRWR
jgi:tetratricopeptide (TPR) repeat protein